jgi:hypothetical protein
MDALRQQQRRTRVPQVVEAQAGQSGILDESREPRDLHVDVQYLSQLPGEDEATRGDVVTPRKSVRRWIQVRSAF